MLPSHVHLVGIGGAGMASLAQYLLATGRGVSGSDLAASPATERLARDGAIIAFGHSEAHVQGAGLVVASDAIPTGNVELEAARRHGMPVLRRADCLDLLREGRRAIMVAGSHGKSTTGGMIACILDEAGLDPGFALGADVPCLGGQRARPGGSTLFVAEACEAFRNLDSFNPDIAVITNIDDEHVTHYASQAALDSAFAAFAGRAETVITSGEDAGVARIRAAMGAVTTVGLDPSCDVWAQPEPAPFVARIGDVSVGEIQLRVPGDHGRRNALAAIAACHTAGVPFGAIASGLARFGGVARRWQEAGTVADIRVIDDFAHHPAEIVASLRTARTAAPGRRIVAAFQPLLHSRVQRLHAEFAEALALADLVVLLEVDAGGEAMTSVGSAAIAAALKQRGVAVTRRADPDELAEHIQADLVAGDLLLIMGGAGMEGVATSMLRRLQAAKAPVPTSGLRGRGWVVRLGDVWRGRDTLVALFRAAARAGPRNPALIGKSGRLSYAELDRESDAVAAGLAARGLARQVIGVSLPLGTEVVVALLGVMKAGGTYLPLDVTLPEMRRRYMLEQAGAAALIARSASTPDLPLLSLDALRAAGGDIPAGPNNADAAYICFTSGSTGYPKGVRIAQRALAALLRDTVPRFGIGPDTRMLLNTSISFDVSLAEIGGTLAGGGALVVGGMRPLAAERLAATLEETGVTHLSITPTLLASARPRPLPSLGCIIACGEPCPPELVTDWAPGRRFFNVYGPTEATIYATAALCEPGAEITIGRALGHLTTHILDAALRPVADGALGELCLSGPGVAAGYIRQPDETAQRFARSMDGHGVLVYRTGDMVRQDQDGALRFIGRSDDQVKLRGNRIELGEIERAVLRQPGIADAAVCLGKGERSSLVCFVQPEPGCVPNLAALSQQLAAWLPESAVPSHILPVQAIHLTPSGKKDRHRMLTEHRGRVVTHVADFEPPRTDIERQLAVLWRDVLMLDTEVGMFDRFAALGGDSLASLILITKIEEHFAIAVPPGYFGRLASVPQMAVQLADLLWDRSGSANQGDGFTATRVYRQMRDLCGHWRGARVRPDSLISTIGPEDAVHDIFLCCQGEIEFDALAGRLPGTFRLHGMRSGHLVIDNGPGSLRLLSNRYVEEIIAMDPGGTLVLAGICQGGTIAHMVAERLAAEGRRIALLALIEPGRPRPYDGRAALFCGEDSFLNPLLPNGQGLGPFDASLRAGYSLDLVPGPHGLVCIEPAVQFLAHHLVRRVEDAAARVGAPT
jgi:UDP-N-acetylmuramate--L-alanine ligase